MAIRAVVTRGFGNGTFDGTIALLVTRGYGVAVTGPGPGVELSFAVDGVAAGALGLNGVAAGALGLNGVAAGTLTLDTTP